MQANTRLQPICVVHSSTKLTFQGKQKGLPAGNARTTGEGNKGAGTQGGEYLAKAMQHEDNHAQDKGPVVSAEIQDAPARPSNSHSKTQPENDAGSNKAAAHSTGSSKAQGSSMPHLPERARRSAVAAIRQMLRAVNPACLQVKGSSGAGPKEKVESKSSPNSSKGKMRQEAPNLQAGCYYS